MLLLPVVACCCLLLRIQDSSLRTSGLELYDLSAILITSYALNCSISCHETLNPFIVSEQSELSKWSVTSD